MSALAEKYGGGGHPGAAGFAASSISLRGESYMLNKVYSLFGLVLCKNQFYKVRYRMS